MINIELRLYLKRMHTTLDDSLGMRMHFFGTCVTVNPCFIANTFSINWLLIRRNHSIETVFIGAEKWIEEIKWYDKTHQRPYHFKPSTYFLFVIHSSDYCEDCRISLAVYQFSTAWAHISSNRMWKSLFYF